MTPCPHRNLRKAPGGFACIVCGHLIAGSGVPVGSALLTDMAPAPASGATDWWQQSVLGVPRGGLVVGAATLPLAWLITWLVPFFGWVIQILATLCHEMGHTMAALVTGRPAIPAFDFSQGGGVTMAGERIWWLLAIYAVLVAIVWRRCAKQPRRRWLLGIATAFVTMLLITGLDELWFVAMGHGGELIMASIFLHRALTGVAEVYPGERWLYGIVGWCLLGHALTLCWMLLFDPAFQHVYLLGKRGIDNDLVRIASDHLGISLRTVAWMNLWLGLAVPLFALLAARWWPHAGGVTLRFLRSFAPAPR